MMKLSTIIPSLVVVVVGMLATQAYAAVIPPYRDLLDMDIPPVEPPMPGDLLVFPYYRMGPVLHNNPDHPYPYPYLDGKTRHPLHVDRRNLKGDLPVKTTPGRAGGGGDGSPTSTSAIVSHSWLEELEEPGINLLDTEGWLSELEGAYNGRKWEEEFLTRDHNNYWD